MKKQPVILVILDGWGYSEENSYNAINNANTPIWDDIWKNKDKTLIAASGLKVGLPEGQMGNSEVGHINIGSGRIVYQELTRIDKEIENGKFKENKILNQAIDNVKDNNNALHIFGLLSDGGVHSHQDHILAMIDLANSKGVDNIFIHAFLDGRDVAPKSAKIYLDKLEQHLKTIKSASIATISGRYYSMDRDNRWDRIEKSYNAIVSGDSEFKADSAIQALDMAYERGETDEFVTPTIIKNKNNSMVKDGDSVVFMNFRADRARQITHAFTDDSFTHFARKSFPDTYFVTLTQYEENLKVNIAYLPTALTNILGEILEKNNKTQLRIAETEKYAHVTFFFNGGREKPFVGEDRKLIPSPNVATYDLQPEMNAQKLTKSLTEAISSSLYDVIICNYANPDMVGHTGNYEATIKAIEYIDSCLKLIIDSSVENKASLFITADHGNADQMLNHETKKPHTAHTTNLVPFIYIGQKKAELINEDGKLSDIAPTLLSIMEIDKPEEMTGQSIFNFIK